ncbi:pseudaminic acid cytidylyltransferase [Clostridium sp.]|uniref:pseudaminic acid cytidylyltransferase n=1 Tax=Clostridium sp. TaxID=1506 RepID=UPI00283EB135|nr:pseudaminic acid cytidylyltransferase [Clostridium sp.]MDR3598766.1 pseudaminic acid cytidylyltransferase [Clostridium sp.]
MSNIIAVIPARSGSKRIPNKNIKKFLGKEIISYSIETAKKSGLFTEIMVSTDSEEIAMIGKKYGAKIPFLRSLENSNDYATTADVLLEVLREYEKLGSRFEFLCCLYPTSPLITVEKLVESYKILIESKADSIIPIVKYSFPIQRAFRLKENKKIEYIWPENSLKRSQDMDESFHDCGSFYWTRTSSLIEGKKLITENSIGYILPEMQAQDIDTLTDWSLAEQKYRIINSSKDQDETI